METKTKPATKVAANSLQIVRHAPLAAAGSGKREGTRPAEAAGVGGDEGTGGAHGEKITSHLTMHNGFIP